MKVTVYIPSYNQKALLAEAIDSVLAQTLRPHEILVVDDASSDGSQELIQDYARRHPGLVKPIFHKRNTGIAQTRNDAIAAATGEAVTYVDGDDRFLPAKLEQEVAALQADPQARIAFSNYYDMSEDGSRLRTWIEDVKPRQGDVFEDVFGRKLPGRDTFRFELVEIGALRKAGGFDPSLRIYEDFDFRIRLTRFARAVYVDVPLAERRRHAGGLSNAAPAAHVRTLRAIEKRNRPLLEGLDAFSRRAARRRLRNWIACLAAEAGRAAVHDSERSFAVRRLAAARHLAYAARHAPEQVTLADLYRVILPARAAERLTEQAV